MCRQKLIKGKLETSLKNFLKASYKDGIKIEQTLWFNHRELRKARISQTKNKLVKAMKDISENQKNDRRTTKVI